MDIKQRIQKLSLDQKAKLYFMGLVRKGIIDRLPDNPKAAYIRDMMDKDDYGRSVSGKDKRTFMEPEDSMPAARARKMAGMEDDEMETRYDYDDPIFEAKFKKGDIVIPNIGPHKGVKHEIIYDFGDGKYNIQPIGLRPNQIQYRLGATGAREDQLKMADGVNEGDTYEKMAAKGKKAGNLKQGTVRKRLRIKDGEKIPLARINKAISGLKKRKSLSDKDKKYLKALNLAKTLKTTTNVKEIATELGYLNESKVDISYTDPGFRFYKMKVDGKRFDREEGTEYLKGLGIDMEIPRSYNQSTLNKIVDKLKEKGINADHDAAMDVS
jgi:hypothetical protein